MRNIRELTVASKIASEDLNFKTAFLRDIKGNVYVTDYSDNLIRFSNGVTYEIRKINEKNNNEDKYAVFRNDATIANFVYRNSSNSSETAFFTFDSDSLVVKTNWIYSDGDNLNTESQKYLVGLTLNTPNIELEDYDIKNRVKTLTFHSNNEDNLSKVQYYGANGSIKIADNIFSKNGYKLIGFSKTEDGEVEYNVGDTLDNSISNLYAKWETIRTLKYHSNYNSDEIKISYIEKGTNPYVQKNVFTRLGYDLVGYSTSSGGTKQFSEGQEITENTITDIYAVWQMRTGDMTINFDANSGTFGNNENINVIKYTKSDSTIDGTSLSLVEGKYKFPTKKGQNFLGWSTKKVYSNGDTIYRNTNDFQKIAQNNLTLYALWGESTSTFVDGLSFLKKLKALALITGTDENIINTENSSIRSFKWSSGEPLEENKSTSHIVSTSSSKYPVYIWLTNGTAYLWSESLSVNLNNDSSYMFSGLIGIESLDLYEDLHISDTSNISNIKNMFSGLKNITSLDLSNMDVSNVLNMSNVFNGCENLNKIDISTWNTNKCKNFSGMFSNCKTIKSLDIKNLDTANNEDFSYMFNECQNLENVNVRNFNVSNGKDFSYMFKNCEKLSSIDTSKWINTKVENLESTFDGVKLVKSLDVSGFKTNNCKNFNHTFANAEALLEIDLTNFDTSFAVDSKDQSNNIKNNSLFLNCKSIEKILFGSKCTFENLTNFAEMFKGCEKLKTIDLYSFDTTKATNLSSMFYNCKELIDINFGNFLTTNVTDLSSMFYDCQKISILDLTTFNTAKVTDMSNMFYQSSINSTNLKTIYASDKFICGSSCTYSGIFDNCAKLVGGEGTKYSNVIGDYKPYIRIDGGSKLPGLFDSKQSGKYVKVTYYSNYGTDQTYEDTASLDSNYKIISPFTRVGYALIGYAETATGEVKYHVGDVINVNKEITLYAKWIVSQYKATYYSNYGDGEVREVPTTINTTYEIISPFSRAGYLLLGYAETATGEVKYHVGDSITVDGDINLYAKWSLSTTYKVTYYGNYENAQMVEDPMFSTPYTIRNPFGSRTGYILLGYSETPTGEISYYVGDTINTLTSKTLYARWSLISFVNNSHTFDGTTTDYLDTGVSLFAKETINKDFIIEFTKTIDYATKDASIMNDTNDYVFSAFDNTNSGVGFALRKKSDTNADMVQLIFNFNGTAFSDNIKKASTTYKFIRIDGNIYFAMNDSGYSKIANCNNFTNYFSTTAIFGAGINSSSNIVNNWQGQLTNMKVELRDDLSIASYDIVDDLDNMPELFSLASYSFNGTSDYIIPKKNGTYDTEYNSSNASDYIYMFSTANEDKDFKIKFNMSDCAGNTTQNTVVNLKAEGTGSSYPGISIRSKTNNGTTGRKYQIVFRNGNDVAGSSNSIDFTANDNTEVILCRKNRKIYIKLPGYHYYDYVYNYINKNLNLGSIYTTFGSCTDRNNLLPISDRYYKGNLSNISIRMQS